MGLLQNPCGGYIMPTMKRTHIHVSQRQIEKLSELSKQLDLSVAELIRRAIDEYLNQYDSGTQDTTKPNA